MALRNKLLLLLALALASACPAATWVAGPGKGAHTSASSSIKDQDTTIGSTTNWANADSTERLGGAWQAGSSYTLTRVDFNLAKSGSPTQTISAFIYSATASPGTPSTLIATASNTVAASGLSGSGAYETFNFPNTSITSGTWYYVVLTIADGTSNASNFIIISRDTAAGSPNICTAETSGSWTAVASGGTVMAANMKIWGF